MDEDDGPSPPVRHATSLFFLVNFSSFACLPGRGPRAPEGVGEEGEDRQGEASGRKRGTRIFTPAPISR